MSSNSASQGSGKTSLLCHRHSSNMIKSTLWNHFPRFASCPEPFTKKWVTAQDVVAQVCKRLKNVKKYIATKIQHTTCVGLGTYSHLSVVLLFQMNNSMQWERCDTHSAWVTEHSCCLVVNQKVDTAITLGSGTSPY